MGYSGHDSGHNCRCIGRCTLKGQFPMGSSDITTLTSSEPAMTQKNASTISKIVFYEVRFGARIWGSNSHSPICSISRSNPNKPLGLGFSLEDVMLDQMVPAGKSHYLAWLLGSKLRGLTPAHSLYLPGHTLHLQVTIEVDCGIQRARFRT